MDRRKEGRKDWRSGKGGGEEKGRREDWDKGSEGGSERGEREERRLG